MVAGEFQRTLEKLLEIRLDRQSVEDVLAGRYPGAQLGFRDRHPVSGAQGRQDAVDSVSPVLLRWHWIRRQLGSQELRSLRRRLPRARVAERRPGRRSGGVELLPYREQLLHSLEEIDVHRAGRTAAGGQADQVQ